jgi:integrase
LPTKKLARRELDTRIARVNSPLYRPRPVALFSEFAERWAEKVLPNHKPSSQASVRSILHRHVLPFFGRWQVNEVSPEMVQAWVSGIAGKPKTVKNALAVFRLLWQKAWAWNYADHDVLLGVETPRGCSEPREPFTPGEIRQICAAASDPWRTAFMIAAETGIRRGEVCGLSVQDVDLAARTIRVRRSVWQGHLQEPKTANAHRVLAISPELAGHLEGFLTNMKPNAGGLLFPSRHGTPCDPCSLVKRRLWPVLDRLGIARRGFHAFRHASATALDRLGVPLKTRQERMGHSDPKLTLRVYTHAVSGDDRAAAEGLGRQLWGQDGVLHPSCTQVQ